MSLYENSTLPNVLLNGEPYANMRPSKPRVIFLDVTPKKISTKFATHTQIQPVIREAIVQPTITNDVVYENIKPVFTVLRILGALPLHIPSPGLKKFTLLSPVMAYCVLVFAALLAYVIYVSFYRVEIVKSVEGKFEEAVIEYLFTVYLFPIVLVPVMWCETRKIADVLNSWWDFEMTYKKVSGKALALDLRTRALVIALGVPAMSCACVLATHATMAHFEGARLPPYMLLGGLTYQLGGYWYLLCETLSDTANVLAEDFQQALRHIGPASKVAQYRALWLRLSRLARDTGHANCYTFTFCCLYLFLIITLSIYGLLSQISDGFGIKDVGLAVTASFSIALLFFICDEAHYASHNVQTNFQKKLLMAELSWMNAAAQTELAMFLRATEMNPSNISLGGFFVVSRTLFKSLMATMVTYLVVLLQFQISIPEDSNSPPSANLTRVSYHPAGNSSFFV